MHTVSDGVWGVAVVQERVLPESNWRPELVRVIVKMVRLHDVVEGAHKGKPGLQCSRDSAFIHRAPVPVTVAHQLWQNDSPVQCDSHCKDVPHLHAQSGGQP